MRGKEKRKLAAEVQPFLARKRSVPGIESTRPPDARRAAENAVPWSGPERRNGRQERRRERIQLTEMGQLAASIAHELRQPLGAIRNLTYYLKAKTGTADAEIAEKFARLDQQADLAGRILSNLVAFGRSGTPHRSPIILGELLHEVLSRISWPAQIRLEQKLARNLSQILADPLHVDRILANLIANALESMEGEGTLSICARSARVSRPGAPRGVVTVEITDTGCGIAPADGEKLFRPFVSTKSKGTGLGLALSLQLAEANDGSIVFRSQPGCGTTFQLTLPAA